MNEAHSPVGLTFSADAPPEMSAIGRLEDVVRVHGRLHPDRSALNFDGVVRSYGDLQRRTSQLANALKAHGMVPGDRLAVILKNSVYCYETLFGARKLGAVQVAINTRLAPSEMAYIVHDSSARLLIIDAEFVDLIEPLSKLIGDHVRIFVAGSSPRRADLIDYDDWIAQFPETDSEYRSHASDIALQLYTSGTTGRPKGAMLSNANLWSYFKAAESMFPIETFGVHLIVTPVFHVASLVWSIRGLTHGGLLVGLRDFDAKKVLALIPEHGANEFIVVPAVLQMLINAADPATTDFSSLRRVGYGGAILTEKLARSIIETFGCPIHGMYGSTELSFGCTVLFIDHSVLSRPELLESCGRSLPGTDLRVVNVATLEPVPDGTVGELWVRAGQCAQGYWNDPEATAESFRKDGWFRTGDMGFLRDGYLYLSDRLKDMVKSGGENVSSAEVERVLCEHPGIEEAVVIGVPDEVWGEAVKAIVLPVPGQTIDPAEVIRFARGRLAAFKCPKSVDVVAAFPRTASGKAMKTVMREPYWRGHKRRIN